MVYTYSKMWSYSFLAMAFILCQASSLKIYKSTQPMHIQKAYSGLIYMPEMKNYTFSQSLTMCMRFNVMRLHVMIMHIANSDNRFFYLKPDMKSTWLFFGNDGNTSRSYGSWVLQEDDSFNLWKINHWHHFCFHYKNETGTMSVVKVKSKLINLVICAIIEDTTF